MAILQHKPNRIEDAVEKLTPMVHKLAHKFARNHKSNDFDDIVQFGFEGLLNAYKNFNPNAGCAFSSYAYQWIWAVMKDKTVKQWKFYNNTGFKAVEDYDLGTYELPLDLKIDADRKVEHMDTTTRAIHAARQAGFTYREIAEVLSKHTGQTVTLHQARRRHLEALID
jgi:RNA polymerase sigma factor (sigma-70 family)